MCTNSSGNSSFNERIVRACHALFYFDIIFILWVWQTCLHDLIFFLLIQNAFKLNWSWSFYQLHTLHYITCYIPVHYMFNALHYILHTLHVTCITCYIHYLVLTHITLHVTCITFWIHYMLHKYVMFYLQGKPLSPALVANLQGTPTVRTPRTASLPSVSSLRSSLPAVVNNDVRWACCCCSQVNQLINW